MKITDKIKNLLRKSRDQGCSKSEAEEALHMALRLAQKFNIKIEELEQVEDNDPVNVLDLASITRKDYVLVGGISLFSHPANRLFGKISHALGLITIIHTNIDSESKDTKLTIFGPERLIGVLLMVHEIIKNAIDTESEIAHKKYYSSKRKNLTKRFSMKDFQQGMCDEFSDNIRSASNKILKSYTPRQLEIDKKIKLDTFDMMNKVFPNTRIKNVSERNEIMNVDIANKGRSAALKYDIERTIISAVKGNKLITK